MIARQARTMIKIYVISENSRQHKIEDMRVPTEIKTNEFLKLVLGYQLCLMSDIQEQFIPYGRTLICKGALTIGLGFDSGDSKDANVRRRPKASRRCIHVD